MDHQKVAGTEIRCPHAESSEDAHLLRGTLEGCKDCLSLLFQRYCRMVLTIGWKVLRQNSEADDLVQEVFLAILQRGNSYDRTKASVKTWIAQLAYFTALTRRRKLYAKKTVALENVLSCACDLPAFTLREPERVQLVEECLAALNPRQRRTIELVHFEGYTLMETASVLKESLSNTRNQYYRGLKSLRTLLNVRQCAGAKNPVQHPRLVESETSEPLVPVTEV
jgi:RNA polymerase sigma-70 factor (ECF subfamily)